MRGPDWGPKYSMEIHFCDLCNESVPQAELDDGRATILKGRVICQACDRAMSHAEPAAPGLGAVAPGHSATTALGAATAAVTPAPALWPAASPAGAAASPALAPVLSSGRASSSSSAMWIALVALAFTAGAVWLVDQRLDELDLAARRADAEIARHLESLNALQRARDRTDAERKTHDATLAARLAGERTALENALSEVREHSARLASELAVLSREHGRLRDSAGASDVDRERRVGELAARIGRNEEDQRLLVERLSSVETAAQSAPRTAAPAGAGGTAAEPSAPAAAETAPAWGALVADLKHSNPGTRWEAVDGLGQTKDPLVVPHLVPMLKDGDVFVRMATARVLGDLKALDAVPALIDALEDAEVAVREASLFALRAITNKDLRFDPLANESERAKRVKGWRDWWKKEQEAPGSDGRTETRAR